MWQISIIVKLVSFVNFVIWKTNKFIFMNKQITERMYAWENILLIKLILPINVLFVILERQIMSLFDMDLELLLSV